MATTDTAPLPGDDRVVGGLRLHVVCYGWGGDRLPLLLLHGLTTCGSLWDGVMRDLGHHVRCTAPDLAGLGRSERPGRPLGLRRQADLLLDLLDQLGHRRVVIAGYDIGGAVAVHLAALAPERVAGLVLVATPLHREIWPPSQAVPLLLPAVRAAFLRSLPGYGTGLREVLAGIDMAGVEQSWQLLRAAPPRTLVLWGEADRVYSAAYGRRIAAEMPDAAWVPVAGAGHRLPRERPERVAEELAGFVSELPAAGPA